MKKQFIYWLFGDKASKVLIGTWHWLWGIPVESGGKVALEVAKESIESMQKSIAELTDSVAMVVAASNAVKSEYELKQQEFQEAENQAILASQKGNKDAARLAMSKAIAIEKLLPKMKTQVEQSEKVVLIAQQKLQKEKEKLEMHKLEMHNLNSLHRINESLAKINDFDSVLNLENAQEQFDEAGKAIEGKNFRVNAEVELSENPHDKLESDLQKLTLDEQISERLKTLALKKKDN